MQNLDIQVGPSQPRPTTATQSQPVAPAPLAPAKTSKSWLIFLIFGILSLGGGVACTLITLLQPEEVLAELTFPDLPSPKPTEATYSRLTGLPLDDPSKIDAPAYCIQIPNGTDGARPHAGLDEAGVIFEAIAERGITRFAAIFQNPTSAVIGPIRSLRMYYLQWDTPFDCAIVHAGGADDALAAVRSGGYKDLTENYSYMYRSYTGQRLWNNLFTNATDLAQFSSDRGYNTSNITGFARLTPESAKKQRVDQTVAEKLNITAPATASTSTLTPKVANIAINYGYQPSFNVRYAYDSSTNTYRRSFESGAAHDIYTCPRENLGEVSPENSCTLTQLAPSVVIAIKVHEQIAWDNYHEDITAIGSGEAYIFQNSIAITGTWEKPSAGEQFKFYDDSGTEIALAPGQTFVSAFPHYGSIEF